MLDGVFRLGRRKAGQGHAPVGAGTEAGGAERGASTAELVAQADAARDAGRYAAAARSYDAALRLSPEDAAIQVQAGHMHKEAGDLESAEARYLAARRLTPGDPDLALQLGHFYKVALRLEEAQAAYRRALELKPGWAEPDRELRGLEEALRTDYSSLAGEPERLGLAAGLDDLVPEFVPSEPEELALRHVPTEGIHLSRLGARRERSRWGTLPTLRGVEAIRGFCAAPEPLSEIRVLIDGKLLHAGPLQSFDVGADAAQVAGAGPGTAAAPLRKHVFNAWIDVASFAPGPHAVELRCTGHGAVRVRRERVVVLPPLREADFPSSDALVDPPGPDEGTLEEAINARPSMVRPARRTQFPELPRSVLVMRTDQLGDMVTSIPAVRRLRELLPDARLVGLVTGANADFARTLGLFDEVLVADFPDVWEERRRVMPLSVQDALRTRLAAYRFDLAIDLAESSISRPLLLLSGAKFLYGFGGGDWPWLHGSYNSRVPDRRDGQESEAQSPRVLALVERLGILLGPSPAPIMRRDDLHRGMLAELGLAETDRYAVLHTGARIVFSRWHGYPRLAELLLERTGLKVVLVTDDKALRHALPEGLAPALESGRLVVLDRLLPWDRFDALLQFCDAFVGNDSGPKHLAALRGVPVVSVHSSRINWDDWGQEQTGVIVSRKVPCAGCLLYHAAEECGKDWACVRGITPEEVFGAVRGLVRPAAG